MADEPFRVLSEAPDAPRHGDVPATLTDADWQRSAAGLADLNDAVLMADAWR